MGGLKEEKISFIDKICSTALVFLKIKNKHFYFLPLNHYFYAKNDYYLSELRPKCTGKK